MNWATAKEGQSYTLLIAHEADGVDSLWDKLTLSTKYLTCLMNNTAYVVWIHELAGSLKAGVSASLRQVLYYYKFIFFIQQNTLFFKIILSPLTE